MATAVLLPNGKQQFFDANGSPLAAGSVTFYVPNTTTFKNTWQDAGETILNTNPVLLDSAGTAIIYGAGQYRQLVKDSLGNTIWDQVTSGYPTYLGPQATLSSASTTDLGATGVFAVQITGTTTINSFGSSADTSSPIYFLTFTGSLTLTYNATSMILPGAVNRVTQANDCCIAQYLGNGHWQVTQYTPAAGTVLSISDAVNGGLQFSAAVGAVTANIKPSDLLTKSAPAATDSVLIMDAAASSAAKTATLANVISSLKLVNCDTAIQLRVGPGTTSGGVVSVTFSSAFPTSCDGVLVSGAGNSFTYFAGTKSASGVTISSLGGDGSFYYLAFGH